MLDYVIGTAEPEYTTPYDINIIGEYNLSGELWQVKPLLDALGIRIWPASPATPATTKSPARTGRAPR